MPPNSLSSVLTVRATMAGDPEDGAKQLLTIIVVHDQLWNMQYAPPASFFSTTIVRGGGQMPSLRGPHWADLRVASP